MRWMLTATATALSVMDVVASEDDMADKIGSEEICGSLRGYMEKADAA